MPHPMQKLTWRSLSPLTYSARREFLTSPYRWGEPRLRNSNLVLDFSAESILLQNWDMIWNLIFFLLVLFYVVFIFSQVVNLTWNLYFWKRVVITRGVYREKNRTGIYRGIWSPYRYFPTVYRRPWSHVNCDVILKELATFIVRLLLFCTRKFACVYKV